MPRPPKFDQAEILSSAARIVAEAGPGAATVAAIAHAAGAPSGSIYHRFKSRDELLGRLWLDHISDFQRGYIAMLESAGSAEQAMIKGVLFVPDWVRRNPQGARIVIRHRREEFLEEGWPEAMKREALELAGPLQAAIAMMAYRLFGTSDADTLRATRLAAIDTPYGAVRVHIAGNEAPPLFLDALIEAASMAIVQSFRSRNTH